MNGAKCFAPPNTVNVHGNQNRFAARRRPYRRRRKNRFQSFAGHQLLPSSQRHGAIAAARDLSPAAQHLPFGLQPGGPDRLHLHLHRIAPAAARRTLQRPPPQTVFPGYRHGHHASGPADLVARPQLRHRARRGGAGGHGLLRVSSRIFARGAHGFRWTARHGAVAVSSRRQRRLCARPVARGVCAAARPSEHRVVFVCGAARHRPARGHRRVGQAPPRHRARSARRPAHWPRNRLRYTSSRGIAAQESAVVTGRFGDADLLEILLSVEPRLLLHLLFDGQIPRVHPERADSSLYLSRRRRGGHLLWRAGGRSHGPQIRHLVFHSGRAAVHAALALREFVLDQHFERGDRLDSSLRVFHHPGLRARTGSRQSGHHLRPLLRPGLRTRRSRRRPPGQARRRHQHRLRLPRLFLPPRRRHPHRLPPRHRARPPQGVAPPAPYVSLVGVQHCCTPVAQPSAAKSAFIAPQPRRKPADDPSPVRFTFIFDSGCGILAAPSGSQSKPQSKGRKNMKSDSLQKQTTPRAMLRDSATLAGSAFLAHLYPATLLRASAAGYAQQAPSAADLLASIRARFNAAPIQTQKLADNVTMLSGPGGSVVVLNGPDGKFVVDTFVVPAWPRLKEALDGLGNAPLKCVIDTHWHFDHTANNAHLHAAGATVLAHENTKKRMSEPHDLPVLYRGADGALAGLHFDPSPAEALPQQTFATSYQLRANGEILELQHVAPAHTDSDIYVHFQNANVISMADLFFNGMYPYIDPGTGGTIDGMIAAADKILSLADNQTKIVAGHGPLGNKADLMKSRDMLITSRDRVEKLKATGKSALEAVAGKPFADLDPVWGKGIINANQWVQIVYLTL